MMPISPYDIAAEINRMRPGQCMVIPRFTLQDIQGNWLTGESGWDRVLGNVIGSAHADIWTFMELPESGDMKIIRHEEYAYARG